MRGFGRIDLRMTPDQKLYVMEANPNPAMARGEDFPESAEKAGISYEKLIEQIARMGLRVRLP
jgi:D-alanine-D-alanine ligase